MSGKKPSFGLASHPLGPLGEDALLGTKAPVATSVVPREIDVDLLRRNPQQPRRAFDEAALKDLADSIRVHGVIQPVVVRPVDGGYEIIAGERRVRAAQHAGLLKVPVVIRDVPGGDPKTLLQLALIENIQRENLNPIEEASAYQQLAREFDLTHEEIATKVGKARPTITSTIRLLELPEEVRQRVQSGELSRGHAVALLGIDNRELLKKIAAEIADNKYSVRHVEEIVQGFRNASAQQGATATKPTQGQRKKDPNDVAAEREMKKSLGVDGVEIVRRGSSNGLLRIHFKSEADLIRIYDRITGK